jgi:hypothetical protein
LPGLAATISKAAATKSKPGATKSKPGATKAKSLFLPASEYFQSVTPIIPTFPPLGRLVAPPVNPHPGRRRPADGYSADSAFRKE